MQCKTGFKRCWAGLDNCLLVAVFILLGVFWYMSGPRKDAIEKSVQADREASQRKVFLSPSSVKTVEGIRVSNERRRVNTIARSMVESDWDRLPTSPAMDMREDGKIYEVLFSLPEGIAKDSVRVTAAGSVLTLTMKAGDTGNIYMQRIRIPCGVDRAGPIQSVVSNNVLCVRIHPAGG